MLLSVCIEAVLAELLAALAPYQVNSYRTLMCSRKQKEIVYHFVSVKLNFLSVYRDMMCHEQLVLMCRKVCMFMVGRLSPKLHEDTVRINNDNSSEQTPPSNPQAD